MHPQKMLHHLRVILKKYKLPSYDTALKALDSFEKTWEENICVLLNHEKITLMN